MMIVGHIRARSQGKEKRRNARVSKACMRDEHKPRAGASQAFGDTQTIYRTNLLKAGKRAWWATGGRRSDAARSCVPRPASLNKTGGATSSGSARIEGVGVLLEWKTNGVGMNRTMLLYRAALSLGVDVKVGADSNR